MKNKLIVFSILAGLMMAVTTPAQAAMVGVVNVNANVGTVHDNNVSATSMSGGNTQNAVNNTSATTGGSLGLGILSNSTSTSYQHQLMVTGNAGAGASQTNMVNSGCPCASTDMLGVFNLNLNAGSVHHNNVSATAVTGGNNQIGVNTTTASTGPSFGLGISTTAVSSGTQVQEMQTGSATSVAQQWNLVNSSVMP